MHITKSHAEPPQDQQLAWQVLQDSLTARMAGVMPGGIWEPPSSRVSKPRRLERKLVEPRLADGASYYRHRSGEEREAAVIASNACARNAHLGLARLYELVAGALDNRRSGSLERMEYREALLDDALDDSFPASDPPAIIMPR